MKLKFETALALAIPRKFATLLSMSLLIVACGETPRSAGGSARRGGNNNNNNNGTADTGVHADANMNMPGIDSSIDSGMNMQGPADAGFDPPDSGPPPPMGLPVLGNGLHTSDSVNMQTIANGNDGLNKPMDIDFNPDTPAELWVVNQGDSTFCVISNAGSPSMSANHILGRGANQHFLSKPSALAFSSFGDCGQGAACFATSHDTMNEEPGRTNITGGAPQDFMGPTLWTSNINTYTNFPQGSGPYHYGHYDMLHNSPKGKGIAWERDSVYWIFDGYHQSITRYDFHGTHGAGGSEHRNGEISRWVQGFVQEVPNVPSHMQFDHGSGLLYVADTGNNRIAVLNPNSGTRGRDYSEDYDRVTEPGGGGMYYMQAQLITLIDGSSAGLSRPSGLALNGEHIFISDYGTGRIWAFTKEGVAVDYLDTGRGSGALTGITFDASGRLFVADANNDEILMISPK